MNLDAWILRGPLPGEDSDPDLEWTEAAWIESWDAGFDSPDDLEAWWCAVLSDPRVDSA